MRRQLNKFVGVSWKILIITWTFLIVYSIPKYNNAIKHTVIVVVMIMQIFPTNHVGVINYTVLIKRKSLHNISVIKAMTVLGIIISLCSEIIYDDVLRGLF